MRGGGSGTALRGGAFSSGGVLPVTIPPAPRRSEQQHGQDQEPDGSPGHHDGDPPRFPAHPRRDAGGAEAGVSQGGGGGAGVQNRGVSSGVGVRIMRKPKNLLPNMWLY